MLYLLAKTVINALVITAASEAAKRSPLIGAVLASIPLVSVLAMIWMYHEQHDVTQIAAFARDIFWLVLPSLLLFAILPLLLQRGLHFYLSLAIAIAVTVAGYGLMVVWLRRGG